MIGADQSSSRIPLLVHMEKCSLLHTSRKKRNSFPQDRLALNDWRPVKAMLAKELEVIRLPLFPICVLVLAALAVAHLALLGWLA